MGFNSETGRRLIFDIETSPLPEAADYLEPAEAPGNYKDAAKIAAYIEEKNAENLSRCALDVDLCRVVAIGVWPEGDVEPMAALAGTSPETALLTWFWSHAKDHHLVGYNCLKFDLPVLLRRSLYLDVRAPLLQIDKYRHPEVTDLQMVLSFNGALTLRGLSFYARRFGLEVEDGLTGAEIPQAVAEGRWEDVRTHVLADVRKTAAIADRCGYFHMSALGAF